MSEAANMIQISPLLILLVIVNIISLALFGVDKLKSVRGAWRIPESKLLLAGLCGPFGGYAGMLLFRHKTRKTKFLLVPVAMFIQLGVIVYLRLI